MKNILESEKVFEAYAQIDYCYYMIGEINKKINKPLSPIEVIIDKTTGHNSSEQEVKSLIGLLKTIIKNKKIIEADYSGDKAMLNNLTKLKK